MEGTETPLILDNFSEAWTAINPGNFSIDTVEDYQGQAVTPGIEVSVNVPENHYNLMMIYYDPPTELSTEEGVGFRYYPLKDVELPTSGTINITLSDDSSVDFNFTVDNSNGIEFVLQDIVNEGGNALYKADAFSIKISRDQLASFTLAESGLLPYTTLTKASSLAISSVTCTSTSDTSKFKTYTLDANGDEVKIFNHIDSKHFTDDIKNTYDYYEDKLNTALKQPTDYTFKQHFDNELSWWNASETISKAGDLVDDAKAFGNKVLKKLEATTNKDETFTVPSTYFLRHGINVVVFTKSGKFLFLPDTKKAGSIVFSGVDSVRSDTADFGLDLLHLDYHWPVVTETTELYVNNATSSQAPDEKQTVLNRAIKNNQAYTLLKDIIKRDPTYQFYYNCPLQSATAIDINTALTGDDVECLSDAKFWYDPNNINNKFVISQLDTKHLEKGIVIAKASKI
jgi:hypothetical protein